MYKYFYGVISYAVNIIEHFSIQKISQIYSVV